MSKVFRAAAIGAASLAGACAIHPVPEDVTGVSTYHIVRQIRCETRQAIMDSAFGWLSTQQDPELRRIALEFSERRRPLATFHPSLFKNRRVQSLIQVFFDTGIAYTYQLQMSETNNMNAGINFLKVFPDGARGAAGLTAGFDRQRLNLRTFTVTDTFGQLVRDVPDDYCVDHIVEANYIYPIAGKIGMKPMIQEFIRLTLFGSLAGTGSPVKGPPTMVDSLEFQTGVTTSATPKITFAPVSNVVDASFGGTLARKDTHKVTVGLAIGDIGAPLVGSVRTALFAPLLTARGGGTEQAAAEAVNQVLTQQMFRQSISTIVP